MIAGERKALLDEFQRRVNEGRSRLGAVRDMRREGFPVSYTALWRWEKKFAEAGMTGLQAQKSTGRPHKKSHGA